MASEKWLQAHADGNIALLKGCNVFRVEDVAYASYNVSFVLIYLEHLLSGASVYIAKHLHLQGNLVDIFQMLFGLGYSRGQDYVTIPIDTEQVIVIIFETNP